VVCTAQPSCDASVERWHVGLVEGRAHHVANDQRAKDVGEEEGDDQIAGRARPEAFVSFCGHSEAVLCENSEENSYNGPGAHSHHLSNT
jgi:hypothetical protein